MSMKQNFFRATHACVTRKDRKESQDNSLEANADVFVRPTSFVATDIVE